MTMHSKLLEAALHEGTFRVKLSRGEMDVIGEFDNGNWLVDVGLRSEGGGVFSGDERAMRLLAGAFSDRADPMDDWGLTSAQRRTAKKAAEKVRAVMKKGVTEAVGEGLSPLAKSIRLAALEAGSRFSGKTRELNAAADRWAESLPGWDSMNERERMLAITTYRAAAANLGWSKKLARQMRRDGVVPIAE